VEVSYEGTEISIGFQSALHPGFPERCGSDAVNIIVKDCETQGMLTPAGSTISITGMSSCHEVLGVQVISLRLYQFRNFDLEEIEFCPGTNLLFGQNGQGKTNLLEAVYFLATDAVSGP